MRFDLYTLFRKNNGGNMDRKMYLEGREYKTPDHRYIKKIFVSSYCPGDWCGEHIDLDGSIKSRYTHPRYYCTVTYNSGRTTWELLETRFLKKYIKKLDK